jgi:tripeptidyl-peptidase-1
MMGVTMVFSSGDFGVAGNSDNCLDPGSLKLDPNGKEFNPSFPSTCPWVTSVGATEVPNGHSPYDVEVAAQDGTESSYHVSE